MKDDELVYVCDSGVAVSSAERLLVLSNGSLAVVDVRPSDTGNYTCRAENKHGADEIRVSLVIQGTTPLSTRIISMYYYSNSELTGTGGQLVCM